MASKWCACMAQQCNHEDCNPAVVIRDDNGVTDPEKQRVEHYECEYGHTFTEVLAPL